MSSFDMIFPTDFLHVVMLPDDERVCAILSSGRSQQKVTDEL
jgi:hypothetical protein